MSSTMHNHERKTLWVVLINIVTMALEIAYGIATNSMALLADGIHIGSHVLAIGLSWAAYVFIRRTSRHDSFKGDSNKVLSLSGFSSGLILLFFAFIIMIEAIQRFFSPQEIIFKEAIIVAIIGLVVNIASAFVLHHKHEDSDHNIRAAYLHVIADAITSLAAIIGLVVAMQWNLVFIDTLVAVVSSLVIIKWSAGLLRDSGKVLVDMGEE